MIALTRKKFAPWLAAIGAVAALAGPPGISQAMGGGRDRSADNAMQAAPPVAAVSAASRALAMDLHAGLGSTRPRRVTGDGGSPPTNAPPEVVSFQPQAGFVSGPASGGAGPGRQPFIDPAHADHRWIVGPLFDEARYDLPQDFPFAPHFYGSHDFQYCTRRDVYGDIYKAC